MVVGPWEGSVRRPRTTTRKPAKTRHGGTPKRKRHEAATVTRSSSSVDLQKQLDQRTRERDEALDREKATAEVLRVISSSPGDLEPVFRAMLESAVRVCGAKFGAMFLSEGDTLRFVADHGAPQAWLDARRRNPIPPRRAARILYRVAETNEITHILDIAAENPDEPIAKIAGARTVLIVPILKTNMLIGIFGIFRLEVQPFSEKQIALVQNFAAQAVIAIENTRLLNELRESLQQQTATADVLKVISRSPGELEPVFQALLENALRICEAKFGILHRYSGGVPVAQAMVGAPLALVDALLHKPFVPPPGVPLDRMIRTKKLIHTFDAAAEEHQPMSARLAGARSHVVVPIGMTS
jgi:GAF domain